MNREIYDNRHKDQGKWLTAIYHWSLILTVTFLTLSFETEAGGGGGGGGAVSEYKVGLDFRFSKPLLLWPSFVINISCLKKQTRISLIQFFIIIIIIAGDKRSLQPIFGDRHSLNSIARFFQNLFTFLGCPCCTDYCARFFAPKALVLSLRSVWCHGNHVNAHTSGATITITFDSPAHVIQVH